MKRIESVCEFVLEAFPDVFLSELRDCEVQAKEVAVFDIETTGLSAKKAFVYLIGVLRLQEDGRFRLLQFFAENASEEKEVLSAFTASLAGIKMLLHFNGDKFDLPFLAERYRKNNIDVPYQIVSAREKDTDLLSYDIYKKLRPLKKTLSLPDVRLKTVERLLGIAREDPFTGGELIEVYEEYTLSRDERLLQTLLLHNAEDLAGTLHILPALRFPVFFASLKNDVSVLKVTEAEIRDYTDFEGRTAKECFFTAELSEPLPGAFTSRTTELFVKCDGETLLLRIPVLEGELKHFFSDYRNYHYLPYEDEAVHKSVGQFVDKNFRQNATKATAYTKRTGAFVRNFGETELPLFQTDATKKDVYTECSETFLASERELTQYVCRALCHLAGFS